MTPQTTPPARPPARRTGRIALLAGSGLLAGLVLSGGTLALWNDDGATALGQIVAGDLDISLEGETRWDETSSDVAAPQLDLDPETFLVRPGDTFEISQDFTTALQGDNMLAQLTVNWADPADLPDGVGATYIVFDAGSVPIGGPHDVGTPAPMEAVAADNAGRFDTYTLRINLEFAAGGDDRFGPESDVALADLGNIVLDLEQARTGEGFDE